MPISQTMKKALEILSYREPDITKTYQFERNVKENLKAPHLLKSIFKAWDHEILCDDHRVNVRLYTPPKELHEKRMLLFFHGGGWVTESIDTYNDVCMTLALRTKCRVASVEYRLAPENPFPNGLEDCYNVAREVLLNPHLLQIHAEELILVGDSAGGNLAAAVSLMARDRGEFKISKQILIYPSTHSDHSEKSPYNSIRENGTGYLLTAKRMCEYMSLYASNNDDYNNPYFAPLLSRNLSNQPKTLIITAQYDPLRDEGLAYGEALFKAGVNVEMHCILNALHGFFSLGIRYKTVRHTYQLINNFVNGIHT